MSTGRRGVHFVRLDTPSLAHTSLMLSLAHRSFAEALLSIGQTKLPKPPVRRVSQSKKAEARVKTIRDAPIALPWAANASSFFYYSQLEQ